MTDYNKPPLDQAIDSVVSNPGETFAFHRDDVPVAVLVSYEYLTELRRRVEPCCHLHRDEGCCDPNDCGPCCEDCPTCPTQARSRSKGVLLSALVGERSKLYMTNVSFKYAVDVLAQWFLPALIRGLSEVAVERQHDLDGLLPEARRRRDPLGTGTSHHLLPAGDRLAQGRAHGAARHPDVVAASTRPRLTITVEEERDHLRVRAVHGKDGPAEKVVIDYDLPETQREDVALLVGSAFEAWVDPDGWR